MMEPISIKEIEYASKILFNGDPSKFYDDVEAKTGERVEAIQCLESRPIVACPGSGKTTVLLAKLIILVNRMPFEDGRGICVLTHTNVAIDLIRDKLGIGSSRLFAYPNFFGTIQSFVDKFLAIPFCAFKYESRIKYIDNDRTYFEAKRYYCNLDFGKGDGNKTLKNSLYREGTRQSDWNKTTTNEKNINAIKYLSDLVIDYKEQKIKEGIYGDTFRKESTVSLSAKRDFQEVLNFKNSLIKEGIISFQDAYCIASKYLDKYPKVLTAFQNRFKFVFIDEMQDTANHQFNIVSQLFKGCDQTILQEFGDPNQAIYEYDGQKGDWNYKNNAPLYLTKSKRFGSFISSVINPLRVDPEDWIIIGENTKSILPPHLIIYDEPNESNFKKVFDSFGKLIVENELHLIDKSKFVAIGRVSKEKEDGKITIKTYWKDFEKESTKSKEYFSTLIEYLGKELPRNKINYSERIINAILHFLDIHDFKNEIKINGNVISRRFSKTTFFDYLKNEDEELYHSLKSRIAHWGLKIKGLENEDKTELAGRIIRFLKNRILVLKSKQLIDDHPFFKMPTSINTIDAVIHEKQIRSNFYYYNYGEGKNIPIKVNTIHGEKGETHTATLYLETYYNKKHDSERISEQLMGNAISIPSTNDQNMAAKLAYVAMSRPERLLCFAVSSKRISEKYAIEKLKQLGWEIITVN